MSGDVVERLRPKHVADEPLARAVVSNDQAERRAAVSAYLVANNALKSEAAAIIASQAAEIERLKSGLATAQTTRDAARENFLTMQGAAAQLLKRAETAERQLAGVVEAADQWNATQDQSAFTGLSTAIDAARTLTNGGENGR